MSLKAWMEYCDACRKETLHRWLDCAECREKKRVCPFIVCCECGAGYDVNDLKKEEESCQKTLD